ncbi:MAG TPA: 5'/3'-nucleotidase SurE, partial [Pseudidiomarina sp.]|nr:5'/3'-nucleotidase SurE [Pseudidiomarina sp.]
ADIVGRMADEPLRMDTILNINVPSIPYTELKGIQVTRLGRRHRAETMVHDRDPFGRDIYWYGPIGGQQDDAEGTDFHAVREGYVSVTPISLDMTARSHQETLSQWLSSTTP